MSGRKLISLLTLALALALPARAEEDALRGALRQALADASSVKAAKAQAPREIPAARFAVFHTNDIHGAIVPTPANPEKGYPASGGAASLATLLKGEALPRLWIDSGDWFQGTPEGNFSKGMAVIEIFNALKLTAGLLGNHDFDYGEGNAQALAKAAAFPVLGSNILSEASGKPVGYVKSFVIVEPVPGVKVGIFGLLTEHMGQLAFPEHIKGMSFGGYEAVAAALVKKLRAQGAGVVIAATHIGLTKHGERTYDGIGFGDAELAARVPGIDLILGGHTHTHMDQAAYANEGRTMITQTSGKLRTVFRIEVSADPKTGRVRKAEGKPIPLDPAVYPQDEDTAKIVAKSQELVSKEMERPIGSASSAISRDLAPSGETPMGSWYADLLRRYGKTEIAAINTRGIREGLPAGPLKFADAYKVMPFDNMVVKIELTGEQLAKLVEQNVGPGGSALQYSGLEVVYDPKAEAGKRVVSLTVGGQPVNKDHPYTATTFDFIVKVDKSFVGIEKKTTETPAVLARDVLVQEILDHSPVSGTVDGRIRIQTP